jgi:hypothetical protein
MAGVELDSVSICHPQLGVNTFIMQCTLQYELFGESYHDLDARQIEQLGIENVILDFR